MRRFFKVLGIVVILLLGIFVLKDLFIKSIVTNVASRIIGTGVHMDSLSFNIFNSSIHIAGFKMYNPSGFPKGVIVSFPKINVIYDRASLFVHKLHFLFVEIELKDMVIIKNKEGKLNVDSLKMVHPSKSFTPNLMQIDHLNLSIGKIVYEDYTVGAKPPSVLGHNINTHQSYKSIPTAQELLLLMFKEPMKAATIKDAKINGDPPILGVALLMVTLVATNTSKEGVE